MVNWFIGVAAGSSDSTLTLTFFLNVDYNIFANLYARSTNNAYNLRGNTTSTNLTRAANYFWMELCRNLDQISGSGFIYDDGLPKPVVIPDDASISELVTTPAPTRPPDRRVAPFGTSYDSTTGTINTVAGNKCWLVNKLAKCSIGNPLDGSGISVKFTMGTLTNYVVVIDVTFPVQPSMDSVTLLNQLKWRNRAQLLNFNLKWILSINASTVTFDCSDGYYDNYTLWLIEDPVAGDHMDITLAGAIYSSIITVLSLIVTVYYVCKLHATNRYIELHQLDFDEEDMYDIE
ncbi:hypothetical protein BV898_11920 [Hypsibius exemplaris]|uniref:Uncharacterized protein n=1 Tax=Hypsibius exemplaris TaxID=2072580 RepID=A0A1W0WFD6_HYPEX|nr:hypothetical protein BV898_11920 [Hypsibius exemplaris]